MMSSVFDHSILNSQNITQKVWMILKIIVASSIKFCSKMLLYKPTLLKKYCFRNGIIHENELFS